MDTLQIITLLIGLSAVFSYLTERFVKLPDSWERAVNTKSI